MSESSSDASQTQTTDTQDNRISSAVGSVNLNTSRSSIGGDVTITTTDQGTVSKAFEFANSIAVGAANTASASGARDMAITQSAMQAVKSAYQDNSDTLAAAYTTAKAGEQKVMVGVGLIIVGIVALKALGKAA